MKHGKSSWSGEMVQWVKLIAEHDDLSWVPGYQAGVGRRELTAQIVP